MLPLDIHRKIRDRFGAVPNPVRITDAEIGSAFDDRLSRDDVFEVMSNERRRCALYYLQKRGETVELGDVVDYVAAWQYGQPISALDSQNRMCVYSALHQVHLPKLEEANFVEYDREEGTIRLRDELEYARLYLEYDPGNDIPWSVGYAGLLAVGVALAVLSRAAVYPFDWLGGGTLVPLLLGMFGVAVVAHAVHEWQNRRAVAELFEIEQ